MREEFEKLPEIANSLSQHIYFGDDNLYHSDLINFQKLVCWINGAWYAYREQQKQIDKIKELLNQWDNWISVSDNHNCLEIVKECADELRELLK